MKTKIVDVTGVTAVVTRAEGARAAGKHEDAHGIEDVGKQV